MGTATPRRALGTAAWGLLSLAVPALVLVAAPTRAGAPPDDAGARPSEPAGAAAALAEVTEDEVQPPEPTDAADAEAAEARDLDRLLCRKRGCCVSKVEDAGRDSKGRTLTIATVDGSGGVCLAPALLQPEPFGTGALDRDPSPLKRRRPAPIDGDDESSEFGLDPDQEREDLPDGGDCRPFEFHLVIRDKGRLQSRQLLSQACNDGHGTAGVGEDLVEVDPRARTFTHTQSGGSNWRGDHSITVGLDPLRIARIETSSYWAGDADGSWQSLEWNWDLFSGDKTWPVADCATAPRGSASAKRTAARDGGFPPAGAAPAHKKVRALLIPRVSLPPAYVHDGWRTTSPGECSALVEGGPHGFVIHGRTGKATDASMRVVLSREDVLFVELRDDRWVDAATNWTKEDHLEVWMGEGSVSGYGQHCGGQAAGARQWGIRLADGTVFPGLGSPAGLSGVETARTGRVTRLKIPLVVERAAGLGRLTVAYSDSDDGKRQKRLIATSQFESGRAETLGDLWEVDPGQAACADSGKGNTRAKALTVVRVPLRPKRNQPVGQP